MAPKTRAIAGITGLQNEFAIQTSVLDESAIYAVFRVINIRIHHAVSAAGASFEPHFEVASYTRTTMARERICAWAR